MKKLIFAAVAAILTIGSVAAQPPQRERLSTEKQVEQLQEQLDLSDEQCEQVTEIFNNRTEPERGNREAMQKMMEAERESMKEVLTDAQYTKWQELMEKQRPEGGRPQR